MHTSLQPCRVAPRSCTPSAPSAACRLSRPRPAALALGRASRRCPRAGEGGPGLSLVTPGPVINFASFNYWYGSDKACLAQSRVNGTNLLVEVFDYLDKNISYCVSCALGGAASPRPPSLTAPLSRRARVLSSEDT